MRRGFTIHHNGPPATCIGRPHTRCVSFWNAVKSFHVNTNGWSDIAYSFGVCPHGIRFVGRGWNLRQFANGSDVVGPDDGNDADWYTVLVFLGGAEPPTPEMVAGVVALIDEGRDSERCDRRVLPHNAFKVKPCPGPEFTAYARAWDNQPLPTVNPLEDDMTPAQMAELKAHIDGRLGRMLSFIVTGKENAWINPALKEWAWADDPGTVTLNEIMGADVDEAAIATAVAAAVIEALPDEVTDQVTAEEVEAAVVAGLGSVRFVPDAG